MKTATQKSAVKKSIDKQLQEVLENEVRKIKNRTTRNAAFLRLFAS